MSRFAIIGLGNFGGTLALELHALGHDVLAIESDPDKAHLFRDRLPHLVIADASDRETLDALGMSEFDCAIIGLGRQFEATVMVALHCIEMKIPKIYAKVVSGSQGRILKRLGVTQVVFPEREVARWLAHSITNPNLVDYLPITEGYSVEQMTVPQSMIGKALEQLELPRRFGVRVIAIRDSDAPDSSPQMPTGATVLSDGDQLVLLGKNENLARFESAEALSSEH
jgi:trk system potassium uptake protein TrkA